MTSMSVANIQELICPRPPHFKPRSLLNEGSNVNILGANASLQNKNKIPLTQRTNLIKNSIQNKKPKISMISFLAKKVQKRQEQKNLK